MTTLLIVNYNSLYFSDLAYCKKIVLNKIVVCAVIQFYLVAFFASKCIAPALAAQNNIVLIYTALLGYLSTCMLFICLLNDTSRLNYRD